MALLGGRVPVLAGLPTTPLTEAMTAVEDQEAGSCNYGRRRDGGRGEERSEARRPESADGRREGR